MLLAYLLFLGKVHQDNLKAQASSKLLEVRDLDSSRDSFGHNKNNSINRTAFDKAPIKKIPMQLKQRRGKERERRTKTEKG